MDIQIVNRSEKILDPNMDLIDKIGMMARICYKNENQDREVSKRIIKKCIESGHESILEHGIISLFVNREVNDDSKFFSQWTQNKQPVIFSRVWDSVETDAQKRYIQPFVDPEISDKHVFRQTGTRPSIPGKNLTRCFVGDVRAWRQVMRERFYLATQTCNQIQFVLDLLVLRELDKVDGDHILFGDIVDVYNKFLSDKDRRDMMMIGEVKFDDDVYTVETIANHYFKCDDTVMAEQASSAASLSVIITTDRATTHQLVRHRKDVAYSQESQRYVNYDKKGYRCIPMTLESSKFPDDFIEDYDLGRVRSTSEAYKEWYAAMKDAFTHYHNLQHIYDDESGKSDLIIPPETCRGVLPNDAATVIGVTWLRTASFLNFCFWRLDHHAQYSIRATIARIVRDIFYMKHPFTTSLPHKIVMGWFNSIKEQKIFKDNTVIEKIEEYQIRLQKLVDAEIEKMKKEQAAAAESAEKK